jgi:signal transduction histidine kinase/PAS domain-containing protein
MRSSTDVAAEGTRTSRLPLLWLIVVPAALVLGAASTVSMLLSDHADVPRLQAVLSALTGGSFVVAGLIARARRPANRTGLLLIAVGLTWLAGTGLVAANDSLVWTIGVAVTAVPAGFLIHLLLAYPSGRLQSTWERGVVATGYVLVIIGQIVLLPIKRDPLACAECPDNAFLVSHQEGAADAVAVAFQCVAVVYLLAVVATLVRRWRSSTPASRRVLRPVLLAGGATLFLFAVSVGAISISSTVSEAAGWIASVVLIGVPFLFLTGLLKSRLNRAEISRALAEEHGGGVQERLRELLHDPTAELLYACAAPTQGYVDVEGRPRPADAEPGRAAVPIERNGRKLAVLVHDVALLEEPELLEQVAAAVALEVERDQNLFALQVSERRSRALLEALPDRMFRVRSDGTVLDLQVNPTSSLPPIRVRLGGSVYDAPVPRELTYRVLAVGKRALETGELQTFEWETAVDGDLRHTEGRFVPSGDDEFLVVTRDVTDRKRQEVEQAALHRVALAVASEGRPERIFDLVAEEVARVLGADAVTLLRYEPDGKEALVVGRWSDQQAGVDTAPVGKRIRLVGASNLVFESRGPLRIDRRAGFVPADVSALLRAHGVSSLVAAPITLSGAPWGVVTASLAPPHRFWRGAEERLEAFTRLVSLALANEEARAQLAASRARLVTAGDEERRRLERNLHDGAQQRLVALSLSLRLAHGKLASDPHGTQEILAAAGDELAVALEELRELARGIHPAVLTERGLEAALASLCDRAPVPVELELATGGRLPSRVEAAAYYVVSEALANVAKYAQASTVAVSITRNDGVAIVDVADDGVGGADPQLGSGLRGLTDRIEALDGSLVVISRPDEGTRIRAHVPVGSGAAEDVPAYEPSSPAAAS